MSDPKPQLRQVFAKVNFLKVTDIDTIKEVFHADVFVQIRWREPGLDGAKDGKDVDFSKYWNPKIVISNSNTGANVTSWRTVKKCRDGEAYIVEKMRIKGIFAENLELHEFPFDVQDLSVVVSSELTDDVVEILEDDEEISAVNVVCFVDDTEWKIHDLVYTEQRKFSKEIQESQFKNPALQVKCVASRRAGFFIYNIILIMTMISSLGFTIFGVSKTLIANRLQLGFIITLTGVTFKMVTNQSLPKIPYLTHLDKFIIGNMLFTWLVCIWNGALSQFNEEDYADDYDHYAFYAFVGLFVVFQIFIWMIVLIRRLRREYQVSKKEDMYQQKAARLMGSNWSAEREARRNIWHKRNKIDATGSFIPRV